MVFPGRPRFFVSAGAVAAFSRGDSVVGTDHAFLIKEVGLQDSGSDHGDNTTAGVEGVIENDFGFVAIDNMNICDGKNYHQ